MCRIAGLLNHFEPVPSLQKRVQEMCHILKHGGPDDEGLFTDEDSHLVLGHRRLSLIDLSRSGHQPMQYNGGRYVISFNGEIYNYPELKEELQKAGAAFTTQSDTEVILAAFAAWGVSAFSKLNGMFAFAMWDKQDKNLYLVRDPSGIKPLYYAITKQGLAFASEIRGFQPVPYLLEENELWPVYLMAYGHLPEPVSILKEVKPLQKGTYLQYDLPTATCEIKSFDQFNFTEIITNRANAISLIKENLHASVRRHLIADAPIGVFLSGGLDSGIIAKLASNDKRTKLNTLSLYFEEAQFSEKKYQDILLQNMQCLSDQHLLKEAEFHQYLPQILQSMDQPSCDGINTWFISKYAKERGLKAVLSGIGGDELYGGYPSFDRIDKVSLLKKLPLQLLKSGKYTGLKKLKRLGYLSLNGAPGKYLFLRGQFIPFQIARQLNIAEEQVWKILNDQPVCDDINNLSPFNQASWIEMNLFMQNQLLRDVDVMSMAHGIEIRVPFLDKEFVKLSMQISSALKAEGTRSKELLIDSFKDVLPKPVWDRPKMGFGFPFKKWLINDEFIKSIIPPGDMDFKRFESGQMHWSQFLSLVLIKNKFTASQSFLTPPQNREKPVAALSSKFIPPKEHQDQDKEKKKVLFLTLTTFSITGGIEKVSKIAGKALYELCSQSRNTLRICSMYDAQNDLDEKYFPRKNFKGFRIKRLRFAVSCILKGASYDLIILSHINLLPIGYLIKLLSPKTKLLLITHGIEAWEPFKRFKKQMLFKCDRIISVSNYTKDMLSRLNEFPLQKIEVLNNCLDPFLSKPVTGEKDKLLLQKYNINSGDIVLFTLTRIASRERYKGYDNVIKSLRELKVTHPSLKYLIVGKYDEEEKERLEQIIKQEGLDSSVIFAGFIPDTELADHFNLADVYIMPSEKEGFGIVFIEAMYYNKPVIAGNKDGSVDALLNGRLGVLVNPESTADISFAITNIINNKGKFVPNKELLMHHFSYPVYKKNWKNILQQMEIEV